VTDEEGQCGKYQAVLITIAKVRNVDEELRPFVNFRANIEKREINDDDDVAIFNVHGTSSHFVVFLDPGKSTKDVEEEIVPYNVLLTRNDWALIAQDLENKAYYLEATKD
jgi:hypothetical protein